MNDNRNYKYLSSSAINRPEFQVILNWIPSGSRVIDLGCGDGTLLHLLKKKRISGEGIEISKSGVASAKKKNIPARLGRIDTKLQYRSLNFDYAICNVTLQMVLYPEILIAEMKRIAKYQIVSFPNFGFLLNRLDLLINGRMPQPMLSRYTWFNTGHIHQLSIADFEEFCNKFNFQILNRYFFILDRFGPFPKSILKYWPNLFATGAMYLLRSK